MEYGDSSPPGNLGPVWEQQVSIPPSFFAPPTALLFPNLRPVYICIYLQYFVNVD